MRVEKRPSERLQCRLRQRVKRAAIAVRKGHTETETVWSNLHLKGLLGFRWFTTVQTGMAAVALKGRLTLVEPMVLFSSMKVMSSRRKCP